ncbi:TerC family protein [Catalinimonas niigatensis]|uniref:TerC family protein n=1 Tax=Catalinimonas niigatensis TaxID=1397264 RepID=UPI0026650DC2|nr:TerC family protein [Catalinimonas niigatensis]WPP52420.1 TerC family protein [Catalinimonas niigatensis]
MNTTFIIIFHLLVLGMLAIDLFVFNRKNHAISIKESLWWSLVWILLAMAFNGYIYIDQGSEAALTFLTGYLLEKSLSIDNLFVFILIFSAFHIPRKYQHKVLFWGILGAIVLRAAFIYAGIALITHFHFTVYILGGILMYSGLAIFRQKDEPESPEQNTLIRWLSKSLPVSHQQHEGKFWLRHRGKFLFTPLFLALLAIEISDIIFAVDSVPAILSITKDPMIAYTSNIFAILGLRALYFAVEGMITQFHYLKFGLAVILIFVGLKMLLADVIDIPIAFSLLFILLALTSATLISIKSTKHKEKEKASHGE